MILRIFVIYINSYSKQRVTSLMIRVWYSGNWVFHYECLIIFYSNRSKKWITNYHHISRWVHGQRHGCWTHRVAGLVKKNLRSRQKIQRRNYQNVSISQLEGLTQDSSIPHHSVIVVWPNL